MKIGTKSLLFGAHQVFIHPWFVAYSWYKLFGFPLDPRLWVAFVIHDWGYWGKPNMDGSEGETHPEFGARLMKVFGQEWYEFCLLHSRFYSQRLNMLPSKLCYADKLAIAYTPWWIYQLTILTGEIREYTQLTSQGKYERMNCSILDYSSLRSWYRDVQAYLKNWVYQEVGSA